MSFSKHFWLSISFRNNFHLDLSIFNSLREQKRWLSSIYYAKATYHSLLHTDSACQHNFKPNILVRYHSSNERDENDKIDDVKSLYLDRRITRIKKTVRGNLIPRYNGKSRTKMYLDIKSQVKKKLVEQNKKLREELASQKERSTTAVRYLRKKLQPKKEKVVTVPNILTVSRIASVPALTYLVLNSYHQLALGVFATAALTDLLDGLIARNFKNQSTVLGTALDPLADKLLMTCLTGSLTYMGCIPVPLTALILGRDFALILGSIYVRYTTLSPPRTLSRFLDVSHMTAKFYPSTISKVNTAVQLSFIASVLAAPVFGYVDSPYLQALMYLTASTTVISGIDYAFTWKRRLKAIKK